MAKSCNPSGKKGGKECHVRGDNFGFLNSVQIVLYHDFDPEINIKEMIRIICNQVKNAKST